MGLEFDSMGCHFKLPPTMLTIKRLAMCSTRRESQGSYIMFVSAMQIRQPTLALKIRGDRTRNPKQGPKTPFFPKKKKINVWFCVVL